MSRTTRKREVSFEHYYENWSEKITNPRERARYYTNTNVDKWYNHSLPRWFRNVTNRNRRRIDRKEIYLELTIPDHEGQYCLWNCKTNNAWDYW